MSHLRRLLDVFRPSSGPDLIALARRWQGIENGDLIRALARADADDTARAYAVGTDDFRSAVHTYGPLPESVWRNALEQPGAWLALLRRSDLGEGRVGDLCGAAIAHLEALEDAGFHDSVEGESLRVLVEAQMDGYRLSPREKGRLRRLVSARTVHIPDRDSDRLDLGDSPIAAAALAALMEADLGPDEERRLLPAVLQSEDLSRLFVRRATDIYSLRHLVQVGKSDVLLGALGREELLDDPHIRKSLLGSVYKDIVRAMAPHVRPDEAEAWLKKVSRWNAHLLVELVEEGIVDHLPVTPDHLHSTLGSHSGDFRQRVFAALGRLRSDRSAETSEDGESAPEPAPTDPADRQGPAGSARF